MIGIAYDLDNWHANGKKKMSFGTYYTIDGRQPCTQMTTCEYSITSSLTLIPETKTKNQGPI
jgi:hypothetical protein